MYDNDFSNTIYISYNQQSSIKNCCGKVSVIKVATLATLYMNTVCVLSLH